MKLDKSFPTYGINTKRRPNSPIVFKSHNKNTKPRTKGAKQQRKQVPKVVTLPNVSLGQSVSEFINEQKHEGKLRSFTIHLQPDNAHNGRKITFKDHAVPGRDQTVSMARWRQCWEFKCKVRDAYF